MKRNAIIRIPAVALISLLCCQYPALAEKPRHLQPKVELNGLTPELAKELASRELLLPRKEIPAFPSEAVVILAYLGRQQEGELTEWPKVAFAIGDGTILLTAAHCVTGFSDVRSAISPNILVISPYYGDIFEFKILAVDDKADLAVLKAPWPRHPALALASEEEVKTAKEILAAGYPQPKETEPPYGFSQEIRMEKLPVLEMNEKDPALAVMLRSTRFIAPGWSGSALVLPKTGRVAGVLGRLLLNTAKDGTFIQRNAAGCSVRSINALLKKSGSEVVAKHRSSELKGIENSQRAFSLAIRYVEAHWNKDTNKTFAIAQELVSLRPASVQAHLFLAWSADNLRTLDSSHQDTLTVSESNYQQALRLGPHNSSAHASYGNFLMSQEHYKEGLAESETALAIEPANDLAIVNKIVILNKTEPSKAEAFGRELTRQHPQNPHYWFWYSESLTKIGRHQEALEAAQKAVDLNPDGLYRGVLGDALNQLGRLDEAEACYRRMIHDCGCQSCWVRHARFLIEHRPEKLDEAEQAIRTAESKKERGLTKESMENLKINLTLAKLDFMAKQSPADAEAHVRQLLKDSPKNGHYWYALAGILRTVGKHEEASQAARQAVGFCPDCSCEPRLADILAKAGHLDEAERTYNEMLHQHPDRPNYWFWYAQFLNTYHPDRFEDARVAFSKAQDPGTPWSVAPNELRDLGEKITKTSASHPATAPSTNRAEPSSQKS